jgi:hypothetical protein
METCTYDLDHSAVKATHYYKAYKGGRRNLCADCAAGFGYPEYRGPLAAGARVPGHHPRR